MNKTSEIRVLVVEDEPGIRKFLKAALAGHGYTPAFAETARDALKCLTAHPPEIVILDLGLPDMDGLEVIRAVRGWSTVPVIVLSARGKEQDKVTALELGADDYLTKPFSVAELLARLKVALRHSRSPAQRQSPVFETGEMRADLEKRRIFVQEKEIHLTPTEYKLLATLIKYAGRVVTHAQLLQEVWGRNSGENHHYLRIYTQHLRQKLGDNPMQPRYIITEAGVGYRIRESG